VILVSRPKISFEGLPAMVSAMESLAPVVVAKI